MYPTPPRFEAAVECFVSPTIRHSAALRVSTSNGCNSLKFVCIRLHQAIG